MESPSNTQNKKENTIIQNEHKKIAFTMRFLCFSYIYSRFQNDNKGQKANAPINILQSP